MRISPPESPMSFEDKPYLSGRAELIGTAIKPQPDGTTYLDLDFDLELTAPCNSEVPWDELLYAPHIEEPTSGNLGKPLSIRIPETDYLEIQAEARITGVDISVVARKRIASTILDAIHPEKASRARQLEALFLRQAMTRAVNLSDDQLERFIKTMATIPECSHAERQVYVIERRIRQTLGQKTIIDMNNESWRRHAYPLQQITIKLQGTRHSDKEAIVGQLEKVINRLKAGETSGQEDDDDFGYAFEYTGATDGPSIFDSTETGD